MRKSFQEIVNVIFPTGKIKRNNVLVFLDKSNFVDHQQTKDVFTDKWEQYEKEKAKEKKNFYDFQKKWYLDLYGFSSEEDLKFYLSKKKVILDAGCGLGYKTKWLADLSPNSLIIGMDYSDSVFLAASNYKDTDNLLFVKNDIANTCLKNNSVDYISCDQVIHHTESPPRTFDEFYRILKPGSELAVYVYAKKALPRELVDDYFRKQTQYIPKEKMWKFSEQLTELGKCLSKINVNIEVPNLDLLGIKGGKMDLQRFIYWNFLKCFWSDKLGKQTSVFINYDWYSPTSAYRYSKEEFEQLLIDANFKVKKYHSEEACHSGRFERNKEKI